MGDKPIGFDALIEAFTIFKKYENPSWPTHCEHDVLYVLVNHKRVSVEDKERLKVLGFDTTEETGESCFLSFHFGSA